MAENYKDAHLVLLLSPTKGSTEDLFRTEEDPDTVFTIGQPGNKPPPYKYLLEWTGVVMGVVSSLLSGGPSLGEGCMGSGGRGSGLGGCGGLRL